MKFVENYKYYGQTVSERCGGHIHIGADYLTMEESWRNLTEIWGNMEKVLYAISNKAGELPRNAVAKFASPISASFEKIINSGSVNLQDENDLKKFLKASQKDRYSGINFYNIGGSKNTIEFRLSNGTIDEETWIQNINLFGGIVKLAEDLALIQTKPENERTITEKMKLDYFEFIKNSEVDEQDKLEMLIDITIPEENREIYRERYKINSELIENAPLIKKDITTKTAKSPIDIKKIGKKVFLGEDGVNGQEYSQGVTIIQRDLQRDDFERSI